MWIFIGIIFFLVVYFMTATQLTKRWLAERKHKVFLAKQKEKFNSGASSE